jgi:hypothetical protein
VRISSFEQADDCPCCHDDLGACWMLDIGHRLTRLNFRQHRKENRRREHTR